jgi:hypothetical protein
MSFKIFTLQLLGKIQPVEKVESKRKLLLDDYYEFVNVEKSDELKLLFDLKKLVNSDKFVEKKTEIQNLQFNNSKEFNLLKEFQALEKKKSIKKYFEVLNSKELVRFETVRDSENLKVYEELSEYVNEGQFQKEKKEIEQQKYKGSIEERHMKDFRKLENSPGIKAYLKLINSQLIEQHEKVGSSVKIKQYLDLKNIPSKDKNQKKIFKELARNPEIKHYFKFEHSKELKLYRETADSHALKKYNELKEYVDKPEYKWRVEYLKDRRKFDKSEAFKKWNHFKKLNRDSDIRFFMKYEKSAIHKNYLDVKDSFDLKRYLELQEITSSKEFNERRNYLEDKRKWEKTEEFASERKFGELSNKPHLVKYFKYKGSNAFDFFKEWEVSFEEDFKSPQLNSEIWAVMPPWAEKLLGRNYSMPGDLHVYTPGQNIKTGEGLTIETRKEKGKGIVWEMSSGFIPQEFEYSSGLISSVNSFFQNDGIFEAKIKFDSCREVVSSCLLQGENSSQRVYLLEMGNKNRIGIANTNKEGKLKMEGLDISNLNKNKWYIFTVEKQNRSFTWKINDTVVLMLEHSQVNFPLHICLMTLVLEQINTSKLPVQFQVEWVRCYKWKK